MKLRSRVFFSYIGARTHGSVLFFIFSSCPEQVLDFFLRGRLDRGSLLKFDLATVRALVWQRLCLKAVMADIAEIVVHGVLHFLCHVGIYMSSGYFSIPR